MFEDVIEIALSKRRILSIISTYYLWTSRVFTTVNCEVKAFILKEFVFLELAGMIQ